MLKLCQDPVYCFQCCFLLVTGEWDVALSSFSSTQVAIQARIKPWATRRNGGLLLSARISQPAFPGTSPYLWKRPPYWHIRTEITILLETPPFLGSTQRKEHVVTGHFTLLFFAEFLSKFIRSIFILVTWQNLNKMKELAVSFSSYSKVLCCNSHVCQLKSFVWAISHGLTRIVAKNGNIVRNAGNKGNSILALFILLPE